MKLSIVIVNWNTAHLLVECLQSVLDELDECDEETEIVIIDNASSDASAQEVHNRFQGVTVRVNAENVGFAKANNQAIRETSGEYILLLNPDTVTIPGAFRALVSHLDSQKQAGAAGARILNSDGSLQISAFPEPSLSRELWYLLHLDFLWPYATYAMDRWQLDVAREVDGLLGACLMVRRTALNEVGLFDDGYFMYSEEIDLCYRLRQAGWSLNWVPQARVIHYGGQSTQQVAGEMFLQLYRSKLRFFRKHYGPQSAWLYKGILLLISIPRVVFGLLALIPSRWSSRLREIAGNYARLVVAIPTL